MKKYLIKDFETSLLILRETGQWLGTIKEKLFDSWKPENLTADKVFDIIDVTKDDFYVLMIDDEPAATIVMATKDMWKMWEDRNTTKAIYLAKLGKRRKFNNIKIADIILDVIKEEARKQGIARVRLDTDSTAHKLIEIYERNGFKKCGIVSFDDDPAPCYLFEYILDKD